jgi:hypothetical protein
MTERDEFKEYRGLTKDEAFAKIMNGVYIVDVLHLKFLMKDVKGVSEFVADFDTEENTMYFSYLKVWGVFHEVCGMSYDETRLFLYEKVKQMFGWTPVPYERGGYKFG